MEGLIPIKQSRYDSWVITYEDYLRLIYREFLAHLKSSKVFQGQIKFSDFSKFAFSVSSGYISPYV